MTRVALVTFYWQGAPVALPGANVTALADNPAIAPLPQPLGSIRHVIAHGNDLYPLIDDPDLVGRGLRYMTVIITDGEEGKLAMRVGAKVKVEYGSPQSDSFVKLEDGRTAIMLDRQEILQTAMLEELTP